MHLACGISLPTNYGHQFIPFLAPFLEYGDLNASDWFHNENIDQPILQIPMKFSGRLYLTAVIYGLVIIDKIGSALPPHFSTLFPSLVILATLYNVFESICYLSHKQFSGLRPSGGPFYLVTYSSLLPLQFSAPICRILCDWTRTCRYSLSKSCLLVWLTKIGVTNRLSA